MEPTVTTDIVVAYAQCPRKAYLLLFSPDKEQNPQSARRNNFPGEQISRWFLLL
jgi:hypothetical protein